MQEAEEPATLAALLLGCVRFLFFLGVRLLAYALWFGSCARRFFSQWLIACIFFFRLAGCSGFCLCLRLFLRRRAVMLALSLPVEEEPERSRNSQNKEIVALVLVFFL